MIFLRHIAIAFACLISVSAFADNTVSGSIIPVTADGDPLSERANFVAFVEGNDPASIAALSQARSNASSAFISHKGQAFSPRVLVVSTGTTIDFKNDDRIYHNAFSLSKSKSFDLGIYPEGTSKYVTFEQPGLVRVYCNMHPDMVSNILVLENPYFFVTSEDGKYRIEHLPDGDFTLRLWAEHADEIQRRIVVSGNEALVEDFTVTSRPQFRQHRNKFGKPYRDKY